MVTYDGLRKSGRVHKALCLLYLPYHRLPLDFFFDHFGLFSCVEALVYDADEANESVSRQRTFRNPFKQIERTLKATGLLDAQSQMQLRKGTEYFRVERLFQQQRKLTLAQVRYGAEQRSFDFRLLHRLIWRLNRWPYDERVFRGFASFENVMEFDDDSASVGDDTAAKTFNVVSALEALGKERVAEYAEVLRKEVREAEKALGVRFSTLLSTYGGLVKETILQA